MQSLPSRVPLLSAFCSGRGLRSPASVPRLFGCPGELKSSPLFPQQRESLRPGVAWQPGSDKLGFFSTFRLGRDPSPRRLLLHRARHATSWWRGEIFASTPRRPRTRKCRGELHRRKYAARVTISANQPIAPPAQPPALTLPPAPKRPARE